MSDVDCQAAHRADALAEADPPARLCTACVHRLETWLDALADLAYMLPDVWWPGSVDANPDGRHSRRIDPPAPVRLAVLDALDTRRGRRHGEALAAMLNNGGPPDPATSITTDHRGMLGALLPWTAWVRELRHLPQPDTATIATETSVLWQHRHWIITQEWVAYRQPGAHDIEGFYPEMRQLHSILADTVGAWRPRPVGTCRTEIRLGVECRGPLLPNQDDGVHCPKCGRHWPPDRLAHLGLVIETPA